MTIVAEITRETYLGVMRYTGRCADCGAPPKGTYDTDRQMALAFLEGWFKNHVLETGHRVVVEVDEP